MMINKNRLGFQKTLQFFQDKTVPNYIIIPCKHLSVTVWGNYFSVFWMTDLILKIRNPIHNLYLTNLFLPNVQWVCVQKFCHPTRDSWWPCEVKSTGRAESGQTWLVCCCSCVCPEFVFQKMTNWIWLMNTSPDNLSCRSDLSSGMNCSSWTLTTERKYNVNC